MGRPRRDSNKSDPGSTAGNVYNASVAAAVQQQKSQADDSPIVLSPTEAELLTTSPSSTLTPEMEASSISAVEKSSGSTAASIATQTSQTSQTSAQSIHRRSLSILELVSLASQARTDSARNSNSNNGKPFGHAGGSATETALNNLNLPDTLRATLEKADSPILNALIPLIRQKLAAKTASYRRFSAADLSVHSDSPSMNSNSSLDTRRSSTSSRSEDHRISHKLAERKRRKEMKDVFDDLKDVLPPGVPKSSKWEILNEASITIDGLLAQEQALLNQRNHLLKRISDSVSSSSSSS